MTGDTLRSYVITLQTHVSDFRGGCLPYVKAINAARSGARMLLVVDGQVWVQETERARPPQCEEFLLAAGVSARVLNKLYRHRC